MTELLNHRKAQLRLLTLSLTLHTSRIWDLIETSFCWPSQLLTRSQSTIQHLSAHRFNSDAPKQQPFFLTMCFGDKSSCNVGAQLTLWLNPTALPHQSLCFQTIQSALQMCTAATLQQLPQFASCHNYIVQGAFQSIPQPITSVCMWFVRVCCAHVGGDAIDFQPISGNTFKIPQERPISGR